MNEIKLASGLVVTDPLDRVARFCREEYEYYDALPQADPNHIRPADILATVGLNSRIDTAVKVRTVHRGMEAACAPILAGIPADAELLSFEPLDAVDALLAAAMTSKFVLLASATKVLHRKRPALVPVIDSVVAGHYMRTTEERALLSRAWQERNPAAEVGHLALRAIRKDFQAAAAELREFQEALAREGFILSLVRILDILVWTEKETVGSYRVATV